MMARKQIQILHIFDKIKVQKQLYLFYFIAIFIPVTIIGSYLIYNSRSLLLEHYKEQAHSDNLRVRSLFLDLTNNLYNRADALADDRELLRILSTDYPSQAEAEKALSGCRSIETLMAQDASIHQIHIYTFNPTLPESKYIHPVSETVKKEDWYARAAASVTPFWSEIIEHDKFGNDSPALCLHYRIFLPDAKSYAVLNISVSNNHIKNRIENSSLNTLIWLNHNGILYRSSRDIPSQKPDASYIPKRGSYYIGTIYLDHMKLIGCVSLLGTSYSDDLFGFASLNDDGYDYIYRITKLYLSILVLILAATSIFIYFFSSYFSRRVIALRESMHNASMGNYHIVDNFSGKDEISDAFADLTVMIQDIRQKEASVYESRLHAQQLENQQQRMEFQMLTSQINPHFLYNTLETIRMRAIKAGSRDIADAVKLLGKSMRYVLQNSATSYITLDKELDYINTYLAIQKLRFHDRINYSLKIRSPILLEEYEIFPLLLQPVVENAVLHGLEGIEENGRIIIHIATHGETLHITIYDNGNGMTDEQMDRLFQNIGHHPKNSAKSIGLYNIFHRIQLCYGYKYGIQIQSRPCLGTAVTLVLPAPGFTNKRII